MDLPDHVEALSYEGRDVQEFFARAAVVVTDYSSIAFNAAYIDRPVVYFQFDADTRARRRRTSGDAGYFDYDRDGFGPVTQTVPAAQSAIADIVRGGTVSRPGVPATDRGDLPPARRAVQQARHRGDPGFREAVASEAESLNTVGRRRVKARPVAGAAS